MNIETLKSLLGESGYNPDKYYIGNDWKNSYRELKSYLVAENGKFEIFTTERGSRFDIVEYSDEDEACIAFLRRMLKDDRHKSYWLGATMDEEKHRKLDRDLRKRAIRTYVMKIERGDRTYPWYSFWVYGNDHIQSKPIAENYELEWKE